MTLHRVLNLEKFTLGNVELPADMSLADHLAARTNDAYRRVAFRELTHWGHAMLPAVPVLARFVVPWSGTLPEAKVVAVREMTADMLEDGEVLGDPLWETWRAGTEGTFELTFTPGGTFSRAADNVFNALSVREAARPREAPEPVEDPSDDAPPAPEPTPESPEPTPESPEPAEPGFAREWLGAVIFGGVRRKVALGLVALAAVIDPTTVALAGLVSMAKVADRLRARRHDAPKAPDASVEG